MYLCDGRLFLYMKQALLLACFAVLFLFACKKEEDVVHVWDGVSPELPEQPTVFRVGVDTLFLKEGESTYLEYTVPSEYESLLRSVEINSSNEEIVKVNVTGSITAVTYGFAYLEVTAKFRRYGYISSRIPVFVSFSDEAIENPEEMYQKWLGRWQIRGEAKKEKVYNYGEPKSITVIYDITISELEPLSSYRLYGWEQFEYPRITGSGFPGEPIKLTARFDRNTGRLVFIRNKAKSSNPYMGIWQSPYGSNDITCYHYAGSYDPYPNYDEVVIGYARMVEDGVGVLMGDYHLSEGHWIYHHAMGFSDGKGEQYDSPLFFPIWMARKAEVSVESVSLSQTSLLLEVGDEYYLKAQWTPSQAGGFVVDWTSSNPEVVSVEGGQLTALSPGEAAITVSVGGMEAKCDVVVKNPYIHFETTWIHDALYEVWDTDGDGEVSYAEAAAATYMVNLHDYYNAGEYPGVTIFHELQYFTSVEELQPECLAGIQLLAVTIPANVRKIGRKALDDNYTSLNCVYLLGPPPLIEEDALGNIKERQKYAYQSIYVPEEYYDDYWAEIHKEGSPWNQYAASIWEMRYY